LELISDGAHRAEVDGVLCGRVRGPAKSAQTGSGVFVMRPEVPSGRSPDSEVIIAGVGRAWPRAWDIAKPCIRRGFAAFPALSSMPPAFAFRLAALPAPLLAMVAAVVRRRVQAGLKAASARAGLFAWRPSPVNRGSLRWDGRRNPRIQTFVRRCSRPRQAPFEQHEHHMPEHVSGSVGQAASTSERRFGKPFFQICTTDDCVSFPTVFLH
jgi:hypothetical protein